MEMREAAALSRFGQAGVQTEHEFFLFDSETGFVYRKRNGNPIRLYWGKKFIYTNKWRVIAPHGE